MIRDYFGYEGKPGRRHRSGFWDGSSSYQRCCRFGSRVMLSMSGKLTCQFKKYIVTNLTKEGVY